MTKHIILFLAANPSGTDPRALDLEASDGELGALGNAIAALLAHRAAGASVLIVIDQLEELFTQLTTVERAALLTSLQHLQAEPRCVVIFTLRADFFGETHPRGRDRHGFAAAARAPRNPH